MLLNSLRFFLRFLWSATRDMRGRVALAVSAQGAALATALTTPLVLRAVIDKLPHAAGFSTEIVFWLALYGVFWTLAECLPKLQHVVLISVLETIEQAAQREYLSHLLAHPPRYHATHQAGSQLAQLKRIEQAIPSGVVGLFWTIIPTCAQIFFATGVVFVMFDAKYAAILFLCLVGYLLSTFLTTGRATELQREQIKRVDAAQHGVLDLLNNIETVKAYARESDEVARQDRLVDARRRGNIRIAWHMEKLGLAQLSFLGVGVLVMTVVAGLDVIGKQLTIGDFILLNAYLLQFSLPASYFAYSVRETRQALVGLEPFEALLNGTGQEADEASSPALKAAPRIEFRDVSLHYPDRATHAALDRVSFVIESGQACALVGATGSGKSSVLKLLARFEDADSGTILIDGRASDSFAPRAWRASIAYANQHAQLFDRTIRENLAYSWKAAADRPDDESMGQRQSTARCESALQRESALQGMVESLQLDAVVARCPEGLDAPVGAAANRLSGGEKQRLNIGRALLANAPLLLVDEPTSALDARTEARVHRLIADTHRAATQLIVAHRLKTITEADLILVFDNGAIVERGTHEQLLAANGSYATLWHKERGAELAVAAS